MFWSPSLVICVIKGDHTSVLWSTNSYHSHFCCKTSLAGPLESEPQFTDCFLCHRTHPLGGSHWNLLWLELMLPKCHVSACCSQKCCLRVSPGGTFTLCAYPWSPRSPARCSHLSLGAGLLIRKVKCSPGRWALHRGHSRAVLAKSLLAMLNFGIWNYWDYLYVLAKFDSFLICTAFRDGMDVQFRVYIEAIVWFREDRLGF